MKEQKVSKSKIGLRINERYFTEETSASRKKDAMTERKQRLSKLSSTRTYDINCKTRKRVYFYCKGHHNTALCCTKHNDRTQSVGPIKKETKSTKVINPVTKHLRSNEREVLIFCKEVSNKVIVLFDSGAQAACIKKKLAKRLNLENINYEQVKFAEFDKIDRFWKLEFIGQLNSTG
ncbi:unnamed protein product [Wuchereria bancrofti]|uniref:Peptidase aspartic putative domain-containing protein n=1 Tax=Wuchereria bancrofti TaxID=6293 RepID=A0A3P7DRX7_WUCBA|nr:unnamed protein product [Wuchereria bancrofti]